MCIDTLLACINVFQLDLFGGLLAQMGGLWDILVCHPTSAGFPALHEYNTLPSLRLSTVENHSGLQRSH